MLSVKIEAKSLNNRLIQRTLDQLKSRIAPKKRELKTNGIEKINVASWFKSFLNTTQLNKAANIYYNSKDSILKPVSNTIVINTSLLEECIRSLCSFAIERSKDRITIQLFSKTTDTDLLLTIRDYGRPISKEVEDWMTCKDSKAPPTTSYGSLQFLGKVLHKLARNDRYPIVQQNSDSYNEIEIGIPYLNDPTQ